MKKVNITIIGGGCSGSLLLVQLIRQAKQPLHVNLINAGYPAIKGIAYATENTNHLLNVRAARMSAFPEEPLHFVKWVESKSELSIYHRPDLAEQFLPRKIYGNYLEEVVNEHLNTKQNLITHTSIQDEVIDLEPNGEGYTIILKSGSTFQSEKIILCTGNLTPIALPGNIDFQNDKRVVINPWKEGITDNLHTDHPVLILGSSLTMADTVISLLDKKFNGPIYILSRHGQLPMKHPLTRETHHTTSHFEPAADLQTLYHQVKLRIRQAYESGNWHEPVLEDLRPHTQRIWQGLTHQERSRFLRHINHKWSKLRHRLPDEIYRVLESKIKSGQLKLLSGELTAIDSKSNLLNVQLKNRKEDSLESIEVQKIINCTGPEGNFLKSGNKLLSNLAERGLIRPCELKLGFDAAPDGRLINHKGEISNSIWSIGSGLRGVLWECTAVPEIRVQTKTLATELVN